MNAKDAGKIMQGHRKRKGLTQDQVVERSSVPTPQYLSALENGRYDVRNSEHFRSLVSLYGLTSEQVMEMSPDALITVAPEPTPHRHTALTRVRELPQPLQDAIEAYGTRFEDLCDPLWQQYLASFNWREGVPQDPNAWLDLYRDLVRAGVVPGEG